MSDNKLLAESTIRRFMKLANVDTLSDNFIQTLTEEEQREDEKPAMRKEGEELESDVVEEEIEDEAPEEEPEDEEMELGAELGGEEMDAAPEPGVADMSLTEEEAQVLIDLGERLKAAMGEEAGEEAGEEEVADMGDMEDVGAMDAEGDEEPAMGYDSKPMMEEEQDEIVQEVLKRVTRRLLASKTNRK